MLKETDKSKQYFEKLVIIYESIHGKDHIQTIEIQIQLLKYANNDFEKTKKLTIYLNNIKDKFTNNIR